ncbi:MAG: phosphoglycerate kinase [Candidatus Dependentiae bacterium]|nr:phosphoglycerate kinase [Candidatus Dependentiae bacterium]
MINIHSALPTWDLTNKRVLVRADLNVPLANGAIAHDYRLQSILPTIDLIQKNGGKVIIITHMGRPKKPTAELSTKNLIPWFEKKGYTITWTDNLNDAYNKSLEDQKSILLCENLRFFPGEKGGDATFAQSLARLGDYYVNDAFAAMHRGDTSITLVPTYFAPDKRTIGLLVEKEITTLDKLLTSSKKSFVLILGGGKVVEKLRLIENMLDKVQTILLCPAIVFTFLKALGKPVGKSLVDQTALTICANLMEQAQQKKVSLEFPIDYQIATDNINGPLSLVEADAFPANGIGISIGPKTVELFKEHINNAHTIFFNAAMGFGDRKETVEGTTALLHAVAESNAFSVVGGGDSVAATETLNIHDRIDYLSTGGGATLTYLSSQTLPGLVALDIIKKST